MPGIISVIIPNYNHAPYLKQRIDSVLNQTFQNFELIILDDLSTDNSREVIESYRNDPRISDIVFNEVNSGSTFKQWEKGIALANGDYIWIAESDDYADLDFLELIHQVLAENPESGLAYCGSNLVDAQNVDIGENVRDVKANKSNYYYNNGYDECVKYAFWHPIIPNASAVVFKRELFFKVDPSFKEYKIAGDWQFWIDVVYNSSLVYLPQKLNYFRQTNTSVSRSTHYNKNNYTIFFIERLKIALYGYYKTGEKIPAGIKFRNVTKYLYEVQLETIRKRIFLTNNEVSYIIRSVFVLTILAPIAFLVSFGRICWYLLGAVSRVIGRLFS